jgi:hypothetical protein
MMGCKVVRASALVWLLGGLSVSVAADDSYARNAARLEEMTPEQKEELARKKAQFDVLTAAEKQHLRDIHAAITADPNAKELSETATKYARWLAALDPAERAPLLDIQDPKQRIARIKEIMQQQEERRFRFYAGNLPEEDRKAIYKWLDEWMLANESEIRERAPRDSRQRIDEAPDADARRRALIEAWQRGRQRLAPGPDDYAELFKRLSTETQKYVESLVATTLAAEPEKDRTPARHQELRQQRLESLVQTARFSRFSSPVSMDELLKFYHAMKPDDPRRERLEGKEGEELRRELQRMYNWEHMVGRGPGPGPGPGGRGFGMPPGPWGPPPGMRGDGRSLRPDDRGGSEDRPRPGDRSIEKTRNEKEPPAENAQPAAKTDSAPAPTGKP